MTYLFRSYTMGQYKVLRDVIRGARAGETVNLTDDEARAYGEEYVKLIGKIVDAEIIDDKKEKKEKKDKEEKEDKIESEKKVITHAKNKGL